MDHRGSPWGEDGAWQDPQRESLLGWEAKPSAEEGGCFMLSMKLFAAVMSPTAAPGTELFVILAGSIHKPRGAYRVTSNARNR